jgi:hypothetical protein
MDELAEKQAREKIGAERLQFVMSQMWSFRHVNENRRVNSCRKRFAKKMVRLCGRCARGERLVGYVPQGHWKTITYVAALRAEAGGATVRYLSKYSPDVTN